MPGALFPAACRGVESLAPRGGGSGGGGGEAMSQVAAVTSAGRTGRGHQLKSLKK